MGGTPQSPHNPRRNRRVNPHLRWQFNNERKGKGLGQQNDRYRNGRYQIGTEVTGIVVSKETDRFHQIVGNVLWGG